MSIVSMTVQEALNKKKILEKKLSGDSIYDSAYITVATVDQKVISGVEREKIEDLLKAQFISVKHLYENLKALKIAINKSNATTLVKIAGEEYTVADAIARTHFVKEERELLNILQKQYISAKNKVDANNERVLDPDNISDYISKIVGSESKKNSDLIDQLTESYKNSNTMTLIDPNNLHDEIEKMAKELDDFDAEVHTALTVSNINTIIEVEYLD